VHVIGHDDERIQFDRREMGRYVLPTTLGDLARLVEMHFNEAGEIAQRCWEDIPAHFPSVELDAFVIMPNHVHGVIVVPGRGTAWRLSQNPTWLVR
jgi:hypothetical protein